MQFDYLQYTCYTFLFAVEFVTLETLFTFRSETPKVVLLPRTWVLKTFHSCSSPNPKTQGAYSNHPVPVAKPYLPVFMALG